MKAYIVHGSVGETGDGYEWIDSIWESMEDANKRAVRATKLKDKFSDLNKFMAINSEKEVIEILSRYDENDNESFRRGIMACAELLDKKIGKYIEVEIKKDFLKEIKEVIGNNSSSRTSSEVRAWEKDKIIFRVSEHDINAEEQS